MAAVRSEELKILYQCVGEDWVCRQLPIGITNKDLKPIFDWCVKYYGFPRGTISPYAFDDDGRWYCWYVNDGNFSQHKEWVICIRDEKDFTLFLMQWGSILQDDKYLRA